MSAPRPAPARPASAQPTGPGRAWWALGVVLLVPAAGALLAYVCTPYAVLRDWYLRRTPYLYRGAAWATDFFTPAVKTRGTQVALLALLVLAAAGYWGSRAAWGRPVRWPRLRLAARADRPWLGGLLALATALWAWGARQVPPAYDEVFSALYCAGNQSLFVTWSYYMLPNNHVLFNLLNGGLFGWLHHPLWLVATGRALSGLAYAGTLAVVYRLLAGATGRRWLGAALAALAGVQYSLWGFGFQARGYAGQALLTWLALAALLRYWQQPRRTWLLLNAGAVVAGYALVPTFLFYHAAQLLAAAVVQGQRRQLDGRFWRVQGAALALAGAFYLPAIGFSGGGALVANSYVRALPLSLTQFAVGAWGIVRSYAPYCFGETSLGPWPAYGLALAPLALLGHRRYGPLGLVYAAWLLVVLGGMGAMRRVLFHRNLLALFSLALVLAPLGVGVLLAHWRRWAGWAGTLLLLGWLGLVQARHTPVQEPGRLYFYDLTGRYAAAQQRLSVLPSGWVALGFSQESFYPYWLYRQAGGQAPHPAQRPAPAADYFLTAPTDDDLPPGFAAHYTPLDTVGEYRLFRRRQQP